MEKLANIIDLKEVDRICKETVEKLKGLREDQTEEFESIVADAQRQLDAL